MIWNIRVLSFGMAKKFSVHQIILTGSGPNPAACLFSGLEAVVFNTHLHQATRLRMSKAYTSIPTVDLHGVDRAIFNISSIQIQNCPQRARIQPPRVKTTYLHGHKQYTNQWRKRIPDRYQTMIWRHQAKWNVPQ